MAFLAPIPSRQEAPRLNPVPSSPGPSNPLESLRGLAQSTPIEQGASWLRGLMDSALNAPGAAGLMGGPWGGLGALIRARPAPGVLTQVVDETGKPQTVFHGTGKVFDKLDPNRADPGALYGPGLYHTESPTIAKGYAGPAYSDESYNWLTSPLVGQIRRYEDELARHQRIIDQGNASPHALPPEFSEAIRQREFINGQLPWLRSQVQENIRKMPAPNIRPAKLDIRNPFDVNTEIRGDVATDPFVKELRRRVAHAGYGTDHALERLEQAQDYRNLEHGNVYEHFAEYAENPHGGMGIPRGKLTQYLQDLGHDGITHIGGAITKNDPHRVWIAFNDNQIKPAYQRMAPVTNMRPWPGTNFKIYELTEDIKDASGNVIHPKNSTMTNVTLEKYGYTLPD